MDLVLKLGTCYWYMCRVIVKETLFQGETWHKFRQAVQKDMMCPSGTLRYIKDIEDIALDLTEVIEEKMRADDGRILSPNKKN